VDLSYHQLPDDLDDISSPTPSTSEDMNFEGQRWVCLSEYYSETDAELAAILIHGTTLDEVQLKARVMSRKDAEMAVEDFLD